MKSLKTPLMAFLLFFSQLSLSKEIYQFNLKLIFVDDIKEIPIVSSYGYQQGHQLGVAFVDKRTNTCTVIVQKPREGIDLERQEHLGHEVRHCVHLSFHE
jgi:hypothetical protein